MVLILRWLFVKTSSGLAPGLTAGLAPFPMSALAENRDVFFAFEHRLTYQCPLIMLLTALQI
jgi:hypothetical protein